MISRPTPLASGFKQLAQLHKNNTGHCGMSIFNILTALALSEGDFGAAYMHVGKAVTRLGTAVSWHPVRVFSARGGIGLYFLGRGTEPAGKAADGYRCLSLGSPSS